MTAPEPQSKPVAEPSLADRYFAFEPRLIGGLLTVASVLAVYLAVFLIQTAVAATQPHPRVLVYAPR